MAEQKSQVIAAGKKGGKGPSNRDAEDSVMDQESREGNDSGPSRKSDKATDATRTAGYFSVYKRGQGYWTRMATAGAAALIAVLTAQFLYTQVYAWLTTARDVETPVGSGVMIHQL